MFLNLIQLHHNCTFTQIIHFFQFCLYFILIIQVKFSLSNFCAWEFSKESETTIVNAPSWLNWSSLSSWMESSSCASTIVHSLSKSSLSTTKLMSSNTVCLAIVWARHSPCFLFIRQLNPDICLTLLTVSVVGCFFFCFFMLNMRALFLQAGHSKVEGPWWKRLCPLGLKLDFRTTRRFLLEDLRLWACSWAACIKNYQRHLKIYLKTDEEPLKSSYNGSYAMSSKLPLMMLI